MQKGTFFKFVRNRFSARDDAEKVAVHELPFYFTFLAATIISSPILKNERVL